LALLTEQIDGKYEILGKIREGGMGAVYKVRHRLLDEIRVVKVVRPQVEGKSAAAERFLREAKVAIRLRHPNIATIYDFAVDDEGIAFIVMEHIDGWSLLDVLQSYGPPPLPLALEVARQTLRALSYLHRQQIVHRDISPDNVMLERDGDGRPLIKLIDLGIAKAVGSTGDGLTTTGIFLGKPRYASPEQFEGRGIGPQSDLYSFAVVLYELLTGRCPVHGQDAPSFMAGHLLRPPLEFDEVDPKGTVPDDLRAVVRQALAKKPQDRMPGAEEFLRSIAQVQTRYPLAARDFEAVLGVLLPLGADAADAAEGFPATSPPPGSTQIRLDWEFGAVATPPPDARTPAPVLVTAPVPPAPVSPASTPPPRPETRQLPTAAALPITALPIAAPRPVPARPAATAAGPELDFPLKPRLDEDETWTLLPMRRGGERTAVPPMPAMSATSTMSREPPPEPRRRSFQAVGIAAALVAMALVGAGIAWHFAPGGPPAPPPSEASRTPVQRASPGPVSTPGTPAGSTGSQAPPASAIDVESRPVATPPDREPAPPGAHRAEAKPPRLVLPEEPALTVTTEPMKRGDLIRPGPGVSAPVPLDLPRYDYPAAAKGSGKRVSIRVGLLVDEEGRVISAILRERDPSNLGFNEAALEAARQTRFQPATRDDVPGRMWTELILDFAE